MVYFCPHHHLGSESVRQMAMGSGPCVSHDSCVLRFPTSPAWPGQMSQSLRCWLLWATQMSACWVPMSRRLRHAFVPHVIYWSLRWRGVIISCTFLYSLPLSLPLPPAIIYHCDLTKDPLEPCIFREVTVKGFNPADYQTTQVCHPPLCTPSLTLKGAGCRTGRGCCRCFCHTCGEASIVVAWPFLQEEYTLAMCMMPECIVYLYAFTMDLSYLTCLWH